MAACLEMEVDVAVTSSVRAIPHFDQYIGPWAMEADRFTGMVEHVRSLDLTQHVQAQAVLRAAHDDGEGRGFETTVDGIALFDLRGSMTKYGSSFSEFAGTLRMRKSIRDAVNDPAVRGIMIRVDSPGGSVAGLDDLAADVAAAAGRKPIHAYIEDLAASAAYYVASQATKVTANPSGLVGSIGTYGILYDTSEAAKRDGIKAIVIRSGKFKGAGEPGTAITDEQVAESQRIVDAFSDLFIDAVARGRGMSRESVAELADGRIHIAGEALKLGLVDAVGTLDAAVDGLRQAITNQGPASPVATMKESTMDIDKSTATATATETAGSQDVPRAATFDELKAACRGADSAFLCEQMEKKSTVDQAAAGWMEAQQKRIDAAESRAETAEAKKSGVEPVGTRTAAGTDDDSESGDAVERFKGAVQKRIVAGADRGSAVRAVVEADPALHKAFLLATNTGRKAQRQIEEKLDDS